MPAGAPQPDLTLESLFPRVHTRALGVAVGLTAAVAILLLTAVHILLQLDDGSLELLNQYFVGYHVTWPGALVGMIWGFATGFVGGWLLGWFRNLTLDIWLLVMRSRADLTQKRRFVDQIK